MICFFFCRSLDLTGPLMIGNLPQFSFKFPVAQQGFVGCIRNVFIDHKFYDLATPIMDSGTVPKCPDMADFCKGAPCHHGNCSNILGSFKCDCPEGYGGKRCEIGELQSVMYCRRNRNALVVHFNCYK